MPLSVFAIGMGTYVGAAVAVLVLFGILLFHTSSKKFARKGERSSSAFRTKGHHAGAPSASGKSGITIRVGSAIRRPACPDGQADPWGPAREAEGAADQVVTKATASPSLPPPDRNRDVCRSMRRRSIPPAHTVAARSARVADNRAAEMLPHFQMRRCGVEDERWLVCRRSAMSHRQWRHAGPG